MPTMVKSHLSKTSNRIGEARANLRKKLNTPIVDANNRAGHPIPSVGHDNIPSINDPSHLEFEEMLSSPIQHEHDVM